MKKITCLSGAANLFIKGLALFLGLYLVDIGAVHGQTVPCPPNIDFENGDFSNWELWLGLSGAGPVGTSVVFNSPVITGPVVGRHAIVSTTVPATLDPYGHFPVTPNGGGSYSMKLGRDTFNYCAERARYYVHVPAGFNDYSFNFRFAIVMEDPDFGNPNPATWGHPLENKPTFRIKAFDSATGTEIPCAAQNYIASDDLVKIYGFKAADTGIQVIYLPWTNGGLPIIGQGGKTVVIQIEALGCSQGGHWAYGYFDVAACGKYKAAVTYCNLDSGFVRFVGTGVTQTYNWYTSNWTFIGQGSYIDAPVPATPDFFYGVLANGTPGCLDTIKTDTVSNFITVLNPDTACVKFGNAIQLNVSTVGGIAPFTTSWTDNSELSCLPCTNPVAKPIDATHYYVTVSDKNGCFRHDTVTIFQGPDAGPDRKVCPLGERPAQLHVSGPPTTTYTWYTDNNQMADYLDCNPCQDPLAAPVPPVYNLYVYSDVCKQYDTIVVYHDTSNTVTAPQDNLIICRPSYYNLASIANGPVPLQNLPCGTLDPQTCATEQTITAGYGVIPATLLNNTPFYSKTVYNKYQFIIPKSELIEAGFYSGTINSLALRSIATAIAGTGTWENVTISLACVNFSKFPVSATNSSFYNAAQPVLTLPTYTFTPDSWNVFTLGAPYSWDTSTNLLVDICMGPRATADPLGAEPVAMVPGTAIQKFDNLINVCGGNGTKVYRYDQRPSIQLNFCEPPPLPFTYSWDPGNFLSDSNAQNPTVYVPHSLNYAVYSIGRNGCRLRDSLHIIVPDHHLTVGPKDSVSCRYQAVPLYATGGDAYQWFEVQGGVFTSASGTLSCTNCSNPTATPPVTTTYAVVYTNDVDRGNPANPGSNLGCPDTLYITLTINQLPPVRSSNRDTLIRYGQHVQLFATGATHYTWTPVGSLNDPNSPAPIATPHETTTYVLTGQDSNGCVYRDTVKVSVDYTNHLLIPTGFTPNGDGQNDVFKVINGSFQRLMEFRVFNRWGQEIFSTNDINDGWDGTWRGVKQDVGNYQYLIRVAYMDGNVEVYKGDVTLIR